MPIICEITVNIQSKTEHALREAIVRITVSTGIGVSQTCTTSAGCRQILIAVSQEETYTISFRAFSLILVEGDVQAGEVSSWWLNTAPPVVLFSSPVSWSKPFD